MAIIGLGRVASTLEDDPKRRKPCTHAGAYAACPDTAVVAGADPDAEARERFTARWGVRAVYADYGEMLRHERPDVVSVCAYAVDRARMVIDAAEAGARGIWCEKAVATSLVEARAMVEACRRTGTHVVVNHSRRWSPVYRAAAALVAEGRLGRIEAAVAQHSGNLLHTGTHAFDVLRHLLGEVAEVEGFLDAAAGEDRVSGYEPGEDEALGDVGGHARLLFESGARAVVLGSAKRYFTFRFEVVGSEGSLRLGNDMEPELLLPAESKGATGFEVPTPRPLVAAEPGAARRGGQVADLVAAIRHGTPLPSTLDDGARALEIALAVHASHRRGEKVHLPLDDESLRIPSR